MLPEGRRRLLYRLQKPKKPTHSLGDPKRREEPVSKKRMRVDSKLIAVLEDAEKLLVQGDFFSAEKCSRRALSSAARLADADEKHLFADRAAAVLLQALFETNRFSNARPSLVTAFGSIEKAPPNSVLVWLSLALDTDEKCNAQSLMLNLLQAGPCRGAPACRWNHRQYLALVHLYAIEVLLPALRDPSEVKLWLQRQPFLPLDPREKQFLEDEVEAAAAAASLAAENDDGSNSYHGKVGGAGSGQGIEPSGSTDLDNGIGTGGSGSKNNNVFPSANAGINSKAFESSKRRTDYSSMPLPTDHISPMKKAISKNNNATTNKSTSRQGEGGGGGNAQSPIVACDSADQQDTLYQMRSFSPVPSDLPFGTLAEYEKEKERGHLSSPAHLREFQTSLVSSPAHSNALSPRPSVDLDDVPPSVSSGKNCTKQQKQPNVDSLELDWLGKIQQAAFDAAGSVYATFNDLVIAEKDSAGSESKKISDKQSKIGSTSVDVPPPPPRTTTKTTAAGENAGSDVSMATLATIASVSIFAYAMYTERVLIKSSAKRAWRGVEDLVKVAFLFTPNPMQQVRS